MQKKHTCLNPISHYWFYLSKKIKAQYRPTIYSVSSKKTYCIYKFTLEVNVQANYHWLPEA